MSLPQSKIFREYDIRGVVGTDFTRQHVYDLGRAFGSEVRSFGGQSVVIGYDGRLSSPVLENAFVEGLMATGVRVERIGLGPTPMLYYASHALNADGAVMVTGSHNPPEYNGFKLVLKGQALYGDDIKKLETRLKENDLYSGEGQENSCFILYNYVNMLLKNFEKLYPNAKSLKVAWDAGNGATGKVVEKLTAKLPGEHILLHTDIDGKFPSHHPDPTVPENLEDLISCVLENQCDFGVAFDGDGDRLGIIDNKGNIIWGDQLMILFSEEVLAKHPQATIISEVKASQLLFDKIAEMNGKPLMWRTGHSLIKKKMKETGAPLAGEMSGHIFFADEYYGFDDALYATLRVMGILSQKSDALSQWFEALPKTVNTPEIRIPCDHLDRFEYIEQVKTRLRQEGRGFSDVDGIRMNCENGWWLLRASNTQDIIVARAEATSQEDLEILKADFQHYLVDGMIGSLPKAA